MFKYFQYISLVLHLRINLFCYCWCSLHQSPVESNAKLRTLTMNIRCMIQPAQAAKCQFLHFKASGKGRVLLPHVDQTTLLNHVAIAEFGPLEDVLLAHNV